jgi:hypothetical protein
VNLYRKPLFKQQVEKRQELRAVKKIAMPNQWLVAVKLGNLTQHLSLGKSSLFLMTLLLLMTMAVEIN